MVSTCQIKCSSQTCSLLLSGFAVSRQLNDPVHPGHVICHDLEKPRLCHQKVNPTARIQFLVPWSPPIVHCFKRWAEAWGWSRPPSSVENLAWSENRKRPMSCLGAFLFFSGNPKPNFFRRKFRSQTSDNMSIWTDEKQRWAEAEKRRGEERERVRRKKIQVREKVGKWRNTVFCQ